MTDETMRRFGCARTIAATPLAVALLALSCAMPAEAGWLARGAGVAGAGYALKENLDDLVDRFGEMTDAAVSGDSAKEPLPVAVVSGARIAPAPQAKADPWGAAPTAAAARSPDPGGVTADSAAVEYVWNAEGTGLVALSSERAEAVKEGGDGPASKLTLAHAATDAGPPPPRAIREAQALLAGLGYAPGPADGVWGRRTGQAYRAFLRDAGLPDAERLTPEALRAMRAIAQRAGVTPGSAGGVSAQPSTSASPAPAVLTPDALLEGRTLAEVEDDAAFARAQDAGTLAAFEAYLSSNPEGRHAAEADEVARCLRTATDEGMRVGCISQERKKFRDCDECPELVVVPAGSFMMGSPSGEAGRDDGEGPVHRVTFERPFAVGVYEVTRGEFARFVSATGHSMGNSCWVYESGEWEERSGRHWKNPGFSQTDEHPAVCLNWDDAKAYVEWLSRKTGEAYRLLSESEWEYVARGGTTTARYWGEGEMGQCRYANGADRQAKRRNSGWTTVDCDDGYYQPAPVGTYEANGFGLQDVLGNVWEWVEDCWNGSHRGAPSDGRAWESGDCGRRVVRGGSWGDSPRSLRSAYRYGSTTGGRDVSVGFRIARTLTP